MKFEKKQLRRYKIARQEISSLKYIFAATFILLFLDAFELALPGTSGNYAQGLWILFMFLTFQHFVGAPDKALTNMIDASINSDPDNIQNYKND